MGENYSLDEINEMLKIIDEDGDGNINFQEFLKIMNQEENF
jgi:Ca2+-binding EF-hand superfamily protein